MKFDPRKHDPRQTDEIRQMYLEAKRDHAADPVLLEFADAGLFLLDAEVASWEATTPQERRETRQRLRQAKIRMDVAHLAVERREGKRPH